MNPFMHQGYEGTLYMTRYIAVAGTQFGSEVLRLANSLLTGALVIGVGLLLGESTCRGLGDSGENGLSDF